MCLHFDIFFNSSSDDPYEEGIMGIDSEDEDESTDYDSVDEDEVDYTDDDNMYPPPVHNSGGTIIVKCLKSH